MCCCRDIIFQLTVPEVKKYARTEKVFRLHTHAQNLNPLQKKTCQKLADGWSSRHLKSPTILRGKKMPNNRYICHFFRFFGNN